MFRIQIEIRRLITGLYVEYRMQLISDLSKSGAGSTILTSRKLLEKSTGYVRCTGNKGKPVKNVLIYLTTL